MGDMNARTRRWDKATNARGRRIWRWATKLGWDTVGPDELSCITPRASSLTDIFLIKRVPTTSAKTHTTKAIVGSDHLSVDLLAQLDGTKPNQTEIKEITRKQRRNPKYCRRRRATTTPIRKSAQAQQGKHRAQSNLNKLTKCTTKCQSPHGYTLGRLYQADSRTSGTGPWIARRREGKHCTGEH